MEKEVKFVKGMIFKKPGENAPDFIKGNISVKVDEFTEFMNENVSNGWINIDLKKSREGKLYLQLNDYKKEVTKEDF